MRRTGRLIVTSLAVTFGFAAPVCATQETNEASLASAGANDTATFTPQTLSFSGHTIGLESKLGRPAPAIASVSTRARDLLDPPQLGATAVGSVALAQWQTGTWKAIDTAIAIAPINSPNDPPSVVTLATQVAQTDDATPSDRPDLQEIEQLQQELEQEMEAAQAEAARISELGANSRLRSVPGLTVANPSGFGADNNIGYIGVGFQERTRFADESDGSLAFGVAVGDARRAVGAELSYTMASFGENREFGTGGFSAKVHRRLLENVSVAVGWNGFLEIGDGTDFDDTIYAATTAILPTQSSLNAPFSRIALTAGIGNGQFRSEEAVEDDEEEFNPFGSLAIRVARPASLILEWTGQDLALGASIAPFKNVPLVITPALRDLTGAGDGTRFVIGAGWVFDLPF